MNTYLYTKRYIQPPRARPPSAFVLNVFLAWNNASRYYTPAASLLLHRILGKNDNTALTLSFQPPSKSIHSL